MSNRNIILVAEGVFVAASIFGGSYVSQDWAGDNSLQGAKRAIRIDNCLPASRDILINQTVVDCLKEPQGVVGGAVVNESFNVGDPKTKLTDYQKQEYDGNTVNHLLSNGDIGGVVGGIGSLLILGLGSVIVKGRRRES